MRKLSFITCLIFLIAFNLLANPSIPVKLKYGENIVSIRVANNTNAPLKALEVKISGNLTEGIIITNASNSIEVKPNNESDNTLNLKIVVNKNCKKGNYTVPLTLQNYPNPFNGSTNIQ